MDPNNVIFKIFKSRLTDFCNDMELCRMNRHNSPIFDILNNAVIYGILGPIKEMSEGKMCIAPKKSWSNLIWDRAWKLENANWHASNSILRQNDLLTKTIGDTRYLVWWYISDKDYRLTRMCEDMSRILCHASLLKRDDYRLKGLSMSSKTCTKCEMYCVEDILHIISQCPFYHDEQVTMYEEISRRCPNVQVELDKDVCNIPSFL